MLSREDAQVRWELDLFFRLARSVEPGVMIVRVTQVPRPFPRSGATPGHLELYLDESVDWVEDMPGDAGLWLARFEIAREIRRVGGGKN